MSDVVYVNSQRTVCLDEGVLTPGAGFHLEKDTNGIFSITVTKGDFKNLKEDELKVLNNVLAETLEWEKSHGLKMDLTT